MDGIVHDLDNTDSLTYIRLSKTLAVGWALATQYPQCLATTPQIGGGTFQCPQQLEEMLL
jgi:hypothetical protein